MENKGPPLMRVAKKAPAPSPTSPRTFNHPPISPPSPRTFFHPSPSPAAAPPSSPRFFHPSPSATPPPSSPRTTPPTLSHPPPSSPRTSPAHPPFSSPQPPLSSPRTSPAHPPFSSPHPPLSSPRAFATSASKPPSLTTAASLKPKPAASPTLLKKSKSEPAIPKNSTPVAKSAPKLPLHTSALDVKRAAAQHDPAWQGKGKAVGLVVWRIEKFTVKEIPKSAYGRFYNGDSYILLHTYTKNPGSQALHHDIHFWLGSKTTQDEAGTAAYKTVELDDYLGGIAVQHREVENYESDLFLSYFSVPLTILAGGIDSGFNHVKDLGKEYRPRLLHLKGLKQVRIIEVPLSYKSLNGGDVFVLDTGMHLYQWYGVYAGVNERHKAAQLCRSLVDERKSEPKITVYHEGEKEIAPEFWKFLGGQGPIASASQGGDDAEFEKNSKLQKRLFKLSDESGTLKFTQIAEGAVKRSMLKSEDAFIFDTGTEVFAWIGLRTSDAERKHSLKYAQDYLTKFNRPAYISVCRILEGAENRFFESSFDS